MRVVKHRRSLQDATEAKVRARLFGAGGAVTPVLSGLPEGYAPELGGEYIT